MNQTSNANLQAIIEASTDAIITIDSAGIIQLFNPAAEKYFGYHANEIIGKNINLLLPSPHQMQHDGFIQNYIKTNEAKIIGKGRELAAKHKNGSIFPIWLTVAEYFDDEQPYFTGFIQDLSKIKNVEEKSRVYEEEFELIFENAPTGIAVINLEGQYLNVNSVLCDILGYSKPELLKLSYLDITHPEDIEQNKEYLYKLVSGKLAGYSIEKRCLRKGQNIALVNESVALAHDGKGNPALLITHVLDVTEEVEMESRAKNLQEQVSHLDRVNIMGEMAAGIAHEINQPLTAIESYSQAAKRRIQAEQVDLIKIDDLLDKISKASIRAGKVIERLRAMVKREKMQHEHFDINMLLEETIILVKTDIRADNFDIECKLINPAPIVVADRVQIQQVILNLIRNAIDATSNANDEKKVIVTTTLEKAENRVKVSIKDYGNGVDDGDAEKLFHPFFTTKTSGMGMGLSICHSIIQLHGGKIGFLPNTDLGVTFYFTLPTALEENE